MVHDPVLDLFKTLPTKKEEEERKELLNMKPKFKNLRIEGRKNLHLDINYIVENVEENIGKTIVKVTIRKIDSIIQELKNKGNYKQDFISKYFGNKFKQVTYIKTQQKVSKSNPTKSSYVMTIELEYERICNSHEFTGLYKKLRDHLKEITK